MAASKNSKKTTDNLQTNPPQTPNQTTSQGTFFSSPLAYFTGKSTSSSNPTPTTLTVNPPIEYAKEFINITIKDLSKLTFTVTFLIPSFADKYLFTVDLTKSGRISNLTSFPTQWLYKHKEPSQSILFDLTTTRNNSVNISAKHPRSTRSCDLNLTIQLYEKTQKEYKAPKFNKDLPLIPYNMITELDTEDELSQTSNISQDDELTFDLTAGPAANITQTQSLVTTLHNNTPATQDTNTKRNKRLSVSQHNPAETTRLTTKSSKTQSTTNQHQSKK
jgi:hypothetical protein